jgi:hypothetical protein
MIIPSFMETKPLGNGFEKVKVHERGLANRNTPARRLCYYRRSASL